jgi:y4mF family transcriptional regulator
VSRVLEVADIGLAVKSKRIELGMTHSQLANMSGHGTRFISELENGKKTMEIGKVLDMLNFLGLDISISKRGANHET